VPPRFPNGIEALEPVTQGGVVDLQDLPLICREHLQRRLSGAIHGRLVRFRLGGTERDRICAADQARPKL
jgi:hypothetical protein